MFLVCSCVHLPFKFGIHLYGFLHIFKKTSYSMYNFGDAMWFASGDKSNGKGYMEKNW